MELTEHPRAIEWLEQFSSTDKLTALQLLRTLKLVSASNTEKEIRKLIEDISSKNKGKIALFPISKQPSIFSTRTRYGSESRLGHALESIEKEHPRRFIANPTATSMRAEKIKHIILVDDIIGSGTRLTKFWAQSISKSLKSWLSYKYCKLWIVTYASHGSTIEKLKSMNPYFKKANFLTYLDIPTCPPLWDERIEHLCNKYGSLTNKGNASLGYANCKTNLIFEWNAPNNSPAILWAFGKSWHPLFPGRAIPSDLRACFTSRKNKNYDPELLWKKGQPNLALNLIDEIEKGIMIDSTKLITILGLLSKGINHKKLCHLLFESAEEVNRILELAQSVGFTNQDNSINIFGKELLQRFRKKAIPSSKKVIGIANAIQYFYPKQYKGVQRE